MIFNSIKTKLMHLRTGEIDGDKAEIADLICAVDAIEKEVFKDRKAYTGEGEFEVPDAVCVKVLKSQIKSQRKAITDVMSAVGVSKDHEIQVMERTIEVLSEFLPPVVEGDELRIIISGLDASNMGEAMKLLKASSNTLGFTYDGKEASTIARELYL